MSISQGRLTQIRIAGSLMIDALEACLPDPSAGELLLGALAPVKFVADKMPAPERAAFLEKAADALQNLARRMDLPA